MDDTSSSNNPIYNRSYQLDPPLIGDILGSYIVADPADEPFFLPNFRLESLCNRVSGKILQDGNLLEGVGSLYCLCMYFTSTPRIHVTDNVELRCILAVEACMGECMSLLQEEGKLSLGHPSAQFEEFVDKINLYDTFDLGYIVAKDIINDIVKMVRSAGDKMDERTKHSRKNARGVKDCFQLHSIYFMCTMALSHICGILMHHDVVYKCPGITESLLLGFITLPARPVTSGFAPGTAKGSRDEHLKRQMKSMEKKSDSDRFKLCFELGAKLCFAVVKGLTLDDAKRIYLVKLRMMRNIAHPLVDYAQMTARAIENELKKERKLTALQICKDLDADSVFLSGQRVPLKMKIPPKTDDDEPELATSRATPSKNEKDDGRLDARGPAIAKHLKKAVPQFWDVVERLRPAYLCFMRLRQPQIAYFGAKPLSSTFMAQLGRDDRVLSANQRLDIIEAAYNDTKSAFIPRVCDPADGLFWGGQHMLEFVVSQAKRGRFICQEDEAIVTTLSRGIDTLHQEGAKSTLEMTNRAWREKQEAYKTLANPVMKKRPPTSPQRIAASFTTLEEGGGCVPNSRMGSRGMEKVAVKKDLLDRLRHVEQEAKFERELGDVFERKVTLKRKEKLNERLRDVDKRLEAGLGLYEHVTTSGHGMVRQRRQGVTGLGGKPSRSKVNAPTIGITLDQSALDTAEILRYRKNLKTGGITSKVHPTYTGISPLWTRPDVKKVENPLQDFLPPKEVDCDDLFKNITGEMRREYAKSVNKYQDEEAKKKTKRELKMEQSKQLELEKLRTFKLGSLRGAMDERRRIEKESMVIKADVEEAVMNEAAKDKAQERAERRIRDKRDERENERIKDMCKQREAILAKEERRKVERSTMEKMRLHEIQDTKDTQEIIRRAREEARMMLLEGRQRKKEDAIIAAQKEKCVKLKMARKAFRQDLTKTTKVVRHGSFHQIRGRLAYYKNVRVKDKPYISYEDEDGKTYYRDTIDNHTSYKVPEDGPIISSDNLAMEEYELEHGEGSYAILLADRAWKDQANVDKGYYDESGVFVDLQGYYDENYEFVDLSHGYFDESGEFLEYANGIGTLDFMV